MWHCGLTNGQSDEIEGVQRRCLKIIFPELLYNDALQVADIEQLSSRRERFAHNLFIDMKSSNHVLNNLLPLRSFNNDRYDMRDLYPYCMPIARTGRSLRSFISYCVRKRF